MVEAAEIVEVGVAHTDGVVETAEPIKQGHTQPEATDAQLPDAVAPRQLPKQPRQVDSQQTPQEVATSADRVAEDERTDFRLQVPSSSSGSVAVPRASYPQFYPRCSLARQCATCARNQGICRGPDWQALIDAIAQGGDDVMSKVEGGNPGLGSAITFAMLMGGVSIAFAALLYPAFQALTPAMVVVRPALWHDRRAARTCAHAISTAPMRVSWATRAFSASRWEFSGGIVVAIDRDCRPIIWHEVEHRWRNRGNACAIARGLRGGRAWLLDHLSSYRTPVGCGSWALGSLAIVRSFGVEVKASGQASSAIGEGLADALNVGSY